MFFNRRTLLKMTGIAPMAGFIPSRAALADGPVFKHGLALFDDLKYPPDFKHFDYVNPAAPQGGRVRIAAPGSFDSLNPYTFKGDPVAVSVNDSLMIKSDDEPDSYYGLVAESAWEAEDKSHFVFRLRPEARFHDGKTMTPDDVVWSMAMMREINPAYNAFYKNIAKVEQTGDREVTFWPDQKGNRELATIIGMLPVLPKHWWTAQGPDGKPRDISAPSLEIPLGSSFYTIAEVKPGSSLLLRRVPDYWGKDLPVNVGTNNFDEVFMIYFRDQNIAFEAFKGDQYDYISETSAKNWATGYDFPAVKTGRVIKEKVLIKKTNGMQGFIFNLRRAKFSDVRLRRAFNLAFDFEWSNANLFYGEYTRSRSYFNNSPMEAKGLPSPEELKLLEPLRAQLPPELFTTEYSNPTNPDEKARRANLRQASKLLGEAGWSFAEEGDKPLLRNAKGEKLTVEFLLDDPRFERIVLPYKQHLELLGVTVTVTAVDTAQYKRRTDNFDFDIITSGWIQPLAPGNEQRVYWGSETADKTGSLNLCGIKDPAIDKLIEHVVFAADRTALNTACQALDRALIWQNFVVPQWYVPYARIAYWNRFDHPETRPGYALDFPTTWWWNGDKAKKTAAG